MSKTESPTASGAAHGSADLHAVRWATRTKGRKPFDEPRWTKWHASADGCRTLCGLVIIIATEAAFTPDTDDEMSRVDCPRCARKTESAERLKLSDPAEQTVKCNKSAMRGSLRRMVRGHYPNIPNCDCGRRIRTGRVCEKCGCIGCTKCARKIDGKWIGQCCQLYVPPNGKSSPATVGAERTHEQ